MALKDFIEKEKETSINDSLIKKVEDVYGSIDYEELKKFSQLN